MKVCLVVAGLLLPILLFCMAGCATNNNGATSGVSYLYVTAQANTTISAFTVTQSTGALTSIGNAIATGSVPSAMAVTPSGSGLFVANSAGNNISTYSINSDGSLTPASATTTTGTTPAALAVDSGGKFLFVANQASSNISVFSINGTTLAEAPGSPFTTVPVGLSYPNGTLPAAVAVSASGKFLYVANQLANFVRPLPLIRRRARSPRCQCRSTTTGRFLPRDSRSLRTADFSMWRMPEPTRITSPPMQFATMWSALAPIQIVPTEPLRR